MDSSPDDLARRIAETMMAREGAAAAWHLVLDEARVGFARVRMAVRPEMLNGHGTGHGGMIFALADSAFAYACNARNETSVAQQASIVFLSPARPGEMLVAEAREAARAGRSGAYDVEVKADDGRIVARFHGLSRTIGGPIVAAGLDDVEN